MQMEMGEVAEEHEQIKCVGKICGSWSSTKAGMRSPISHLNWRIF